MFGLRPKLGFGLWTIVTYILWQTDTDRLFQLLQKIIHVSSSYCFGIVNCQNSIKVLSCSNVGHLNTGQTIRKIWNHITIQCVGLSLLTGLLSPYYLLTNWLAYLNGRIQSPRPDVMPDRREGITRAAGFGFACTDTQAS